MAYGRPFGQPPRGIIQGTPGVAKSTQGKQDSADGAIAALLIAHPTRCRPRPPQPACSLAEMGAVQVTVASTDQLVEGMLKGAVDVAMINPVPDDRMFYRDLLIEDLVVVGGPASDLQANNPMSFAELVDLPLVLPSSPTGIGNTVENTALRLKVKLRSRFATDSLQVAKGLIEAGLAYGVLPLSACGIEIESRRLRYAPLCEPALTQQLGVAATSQLELPREFAAKIGNIIREEAARLTKSGAWPARFLSPDRWDPSSA